MTSKLDKLLFLQGGRCFFCAQLLPRERASVEHLVALANGGDNKDSNCVVCCKSVNAMLADRSIKEKIQVVLNQRGSFICPDTSEALPPPADAEAYALIVANLRKRSKNTRPASLKTLRTVIKTQLPSLDAAGLEAVVEQLISSGDVEADGAGKLTYLFDSTAT